MSTASGSRSGPRRPAPVSVRGGQRTDPAGLPARTPRGQNPAGTARPRPPEAPPATPSDESAAAPRAKELLDQLTERTADLQRVKAEYDNYRKQVRRDRLAVREVAVANVLRGLLPVLDALAQARAQGEVTGGFGAVAGELESRLAELGLEGFGEPGEPFDPTRHEAISRTVPSEPTSATGATGMTCTEIVRRGYRVGGQLLRPAEVVVADPPTPAPT
ncbi:nucleotide exchange factor GrpE [Streptomyces sp. NPDC047108]|uniref:nucleotide exchange factor GrpE n=1 Tax=Streptomyces sp. NPDC047108 TaxID=3155025 RepID=UPI003401D97B